MNTPTKLTMLRIFLAVVIMVLLMFPWDAVGVSFPVIRYYIDIDLKYAIAGGIFIFASFTDFLDGYLARKNKEVTEMGKMLDAIADKILINSVLIIFAADGFIPAFVPVIIIVRDIVVNAVRLEVATKGIVVEASDSGKIKTATLMIGMILMFFSNMPFELINIRVDLLFIYFATIMSLTSMFGYYYTNKKALLSKSE